MFREGRFFNPAEAGIETAETPAEFRGKAASANYEHLKRLEGGRFSKLLRKKVGMFALTSLVAIGAAEARAQQQPQVPKGEQETTFKIDAEKYRKDYQRSYEEFADMMERQGLGKKVEHLRQQFGSALDKFMEFNRVIRGLKAYEETKQGVAVNDENVFVKKDFPLSVTPGSTLHYEFTERWNDQEKKDAGQMSFEIKGFENIPGTSNEEIRKILEAKYSAAYLKGSMREIEFVPEVVEVRDGLIRLGSAEQFGMSAMMRKDLRALLKVYQTPQGHTRESIMQILDHEMAHSNSWMNNRLLNNRDRLEFMFDAAQAYTQPDRYKSQYVEEWVNSDDKQLEAHVRVEEYWAEVAKELNGTNAEAFREKHPREAQLYDKWKERIDAKAK